MKVAIAGAGAVGRSIARELLENHHDVTLIERNPGHIDVDAVGIDLSLPWRTMLEEAKSAARALKTIAASA